MTKNFDELEKQAETVRTNVLPESNTAGLVGGLFKDIVAKLREAISSFRNFPSDLIGKLSVRLTKEKVAIDSTRYVYDPGSDTYKESAASAEIPCATMETAGVMSAEDKALLKKLEEKFDGGSSVGVPSINFSQLDTLNDPTIFCMDGSPTFYGVVASKVGGGSINMGVLRLFSDDMSHVVTQVLTTHQIYDSDKHSWSGHSDSELYTYFRSYNFNAPHLTADKGSWTEWQSYVEPLIKKMILGTGGSVGSIADSKIDEIWNINE